MVSRVRLAAGFSPRPTPNAAVYAFIDVEIGEIGTGDVNDNPGAAPPDKQVWKPIRGLVSIDYSPTESSV